MGTDQKAQLADSSDSSEDSPVSDSSMVEFRGIKKGFVMCVPLALGVAGYGVGFGLLANQAGLSVLEAALMSATVVAGAAQIVAIEMWSDPIPVSAILLAVFAVNLRYSLMGAALHPWFKRLSWKQTYGSLFFMADENWALTMNDLQSGSGRGAYLLGSGLAIWSFWILSTVFGAVAGGLIDNPATYGFDFILAAVFTALAVELWDGKKTVLPWGVAVFVAVFTAEITTGEWYILAGGIAAAIVEVIRYD